MAYSNLPAQLWDIMAAVRDTAPLVHNITNLVVQNDTADAIAAVGGTQITLHTEEEARDAGSICGALALNLGTLDESLLRCARDALAGAGEHGRPWVLDPVAAGLTTYRGAAAREFVQAGPTVLKANASEVMALAGLAEGGRGADSIHSVETAAAAARELAGRYGAIVAVTGEQDWITDGVRSATIANGRPLMGRMIGSGCMLTSVVGCALAVADSPWEAVLAAVAYFDVAGELASEGAGGPGTLKPLFIDALYGLEREAFQARVAVTLEA